MKIESNKAVIYARVSSEEQAKGYSLTGQEDICRKYAERNNLEVVKVWSGPESAWSGGRVNFNEMLAFIKANPKVKHIVFYVEDRMTRNFMDKLQIDFLVTACGVQVHFAESNKKYDQNASATDKLLLNVLVAFATNTSDTISEKTRMGLLTKAKQGLYTGSAPVGYKNTTEGGVKLIVPDPVQAPLVKELFDLAASGLYSLRMLETVMFERGLRTKRGNKVKQSSIHYIIKNKLYYGVYVFNKEEFMGKHTPLITEEIYKKAKAALAQSWRPHITKQNHPFSNLMVCKTCGASLVADRAKGKYMYYRCSGSKGRHEGNYYFKEAEIISIFAKIIAGITIPKEIAAWMKKCLKSYLARLKRQKTADIGQIKRKLTLTREKLERLYSTSLDKGYTADFIKYNEDNLKNQIIDFELAISQHSLNLEEMEEKSNKIINLLYSLGYDYSRASLHQKADFMRQITSKLEACGDTIIPVYREPFNIFLDGNMAKKECLEPVVNDPKSPKHLEWLPGLGSNQQP